jgi:antitoxin component of RelBE/YafQ-DinJ toxin-antitoxin module
MAKTAMTYTRITPEIKTEAERIIKGLGLSDRSTLFSRGEL